MSVKYVWLISLMLVLLYGCAPRQVVPVAPAAPAKLVPATAKELRAAIALQNVRSLHAEVKAVVYKGDVKEGSGNGAFVWHPPDEWALSIFGPFGSTVFEVVRDDGKVEAFTPGNGVMYVGNMQPIGPNVEGAVYEVFEDPLGHRLRMTSPSGEAAADYYFAPDTHVNTAVSMLHEGREAMRVSYSEFAKGVPMRIGMMFPNGYKIELKLIDPEIDGETSEDVFELRRKTSAVLPLERLIYFDTQ